MLIYRLFHFNNVRLLRMCKDSLLFLRAYILQFITLVRFNTCLIYAIMLHLLKLVL